MMIGMISSCNYIDFGFTMFQANGDTIRCNLDAIIFRPVDVAKLGANRVRMISDSTSDVIRILALVCESDKSVTTGEGVELIVRVALGELIVPHRLALTCSDGCLEELVELRVGVEIAGPERLTVLRVVATVEALLGTVVDNGDTRGEQGEDKGIAILPGIGLDREETSLVVVIDEGSDDARILVVLVVVLKAGAEIAHRVATCKDVAHCEEHRVAQNAVQDLLVARRS